jgi:hypothetical protein
MYSKIAPSSLRTNRFRKLWLPMRQSRNALFVGFSLSAQLPILTRPHSATESTRVGWDRQAFRTIREFVYSPRVSREAPFSQRDAI